MLFADGQKNPTPPWSIGVSPEARLDPRGGVLCFEAESISSTFEKEVKEETNS